MLSPFLNRRAVEREAAELDNEIEAATTDPSLISGPISAYQWAYHLSLRVAIKLFWGCRDEALIHGIEDAIEALRRRYESFENMVLDSTAMEQNDWPLAAWIAARLRGNAHPKLRSDFKALIARHAKAVWSKPDDYRDSPFTAALAQCADPSELPDGFVDFCITLLIAGYDPPASTIAWLLLELAQDPGLQKEIRDDLHARGATAGPTNSGVLSASVLEVLRLYPPLFSITRTATEPLHLGDFELPVGTYLAPSVFLMHREEAYWEEPEVFRHARFLGKKKLALSDGYLPFGAQSRACPGRHFAVSFVERFVAHILLHFDIHKVDDVPKPVTFGPTLVPPESARIQLRPFGSRF